ncbi:5-(carboxyamino)imidazole ribonucleotide mutase [Erysipelotrichaceae bacterium OttesenSCG-928-M19]|nr:5-(carboxyamino)imidazole ribonucleotide mutase [Erysipelotrichaceae bacterium OttesenSCG-928-M19]
MKVAIIMGSNSDYEIMKKAEEVLNEFGITYETKVVSAHRTPKMMYDFALNAYQDGFKVIIAGAGGAAHLPGMVASLTCLPVIGVPIKLKALEGLDSLLSIVQMPNGVPVATMGINQAGNAALHAISILACNDEKLYNKLLVFKESLVKKVNEMELK